MATLETDCTVVGAGAAGLAFADVMVAESAADLLLVDRRAGWAASGTRCCCPPVASAASHAHGPRLREAFVLRQAHVRQAVQRAEQLLD